VLAGRHPFVLRAEGLEILTVGAFGVKPLDIVTFGGRVDTERHRISHRIGNDSPTVTVETVVAARHLAVALFIYELVERAQLLARAHLHPLDDAPVVLALTLQGNPVAVERGGRFGGRGVDRLLA